MHRTALKVAALTTSAALLAACASDPVVVTDTSTPIFTKDGRVISTGTVSPGRQIADRRNRSGEDPIDNDPNNEVLVDVVDLDADGFDDRDTDRDGDLDDDD